MIQAYGDRILVRIVELEKKKSTLIIPDEKKEYQIGRVESVGFDILQSFEGMDLGQAGEGDYIYTRKYAGLLLEYDGVEYVSLDSKEILAYSEELK